jgi:hypothetical protein
MSFRIGLNRFKRLWSDFCFGLELTYMLATNPKPWKPDQNRQAAPTRHVMWSNKYIVSLRRSDNLVPKKYYMGIYTHCKSYLEIFQVLHLTNEEGELTTSLQMNQLSLRNNWLSLKTSVKVLIALHELI